MEETHAHAHGHTCTHTCACTWTDMYTITTYACTNVKCPNDTHILIGYLYRRLSEGATVVASPR